MGEFAGAFHDADRVEVLDIYAASEEPIAGVDSRALVKEIRAVSGNGVAYAASVPEAVEALVRGAKDGDVILAGGWECVGGGAFLLEALGQKLNTVAR
jgi:UDP-N-acetylmuramate--alanine ligase